MFSILKRGKRNLLKNKAESYLKQITYIPAKKTNTQKTVFTDAQTGNGGIKYSSRDENVKYSSRDSAIEYSARDSYTQYSIGTLSKDAYDQEKIAELMRSYTQSQNISALGQKLMQRRDQSFSQCVLSYITENNLRNTDVYRAAKMDRRLFSKMMTDVNFQPSKDTALSVVIALKLPLKEAYELLSRAGYVLSHSNRRDIVIEYFISQEIYDLSDINDVLYRLNERIIGR